MSDWGPVEEICDKISNYEEIATSLTWSMDIYANSYNSLIDTGATVSIIQPGVYESIPTKYRPALNHYTTRLKVANGQDIQTYGKVEIPITLINGKKLIHSFVVAEIDVPVIIGLDFLLDKVQKIDFEKGTLKINGINYKYNINTDIVQTSNVYIAHDTVIPAGMEVMIRGKIKGAKPGDSVLVDSDKSFTDRTGLLVAQVIVTPKRDKVPLRVMNVGTEEIHLKRGIKVGLGHLVIDAEEPIKQDNIESDNESKISDDRVPEHLDNVIKDLETKLNPEQLKEAKAFLLKYQNCFPKSKTDLGFTDVITHSINTGDKSPIKQAPRRIPLTKKDAAYAEIHKMIEAFNIALFVIFTARSLVSST